MRKADNLPPYCAVVKKSRRLNFLHPSGPAWPVTGVLYLYLLLGKTLNMFVACSKALFRHLLRKAAISTIRIGSLRPESQTQNHPNKRQGVKYSGPTFANSYINSWRWSVKYPNMSDRNISNIVALSNSKLL